MFKVSTKGDYGLLLMAALAEKDNDQFVSLKGLARTKKLSFSYLSQIILPLKKAKLVESKEGLYGGYRLAKSPEKITLMEILEALEGDITPVKCSGGSHGQCQCESVCGVKYAWQDAILLLRQYFKSRTLADVANKKPSDNILFIS